MTEARGSFNAKAKRELDRQPARSSLARRLPGGGLEDRGPQRRLAAT